MSLELGKMLRNRTERPCAACGHDSPAVLRSPVVMCCGPIMLWGGSPTRRRRKVRRGTGRETRLTTKLQFRLT